MPFGGDWKALYRAARDGDLDGIQRWLNEGVDPNFQHPEFGTTPLIAAAECGHLEAVKALVIGGARPEVVADWDRCTAEQAARELGHRRVAAWLAEAQSSDELERKPPVTSPGAPSQTSIKSRGKTD